MRYLRINANKFLIIVLCCSVFLTGCFIYLPEPPSKDEIETWFRENREDITLVTKELLQLDCDTCFIMDVYSEGIKYVDFPANFDNPDFCSAAKRLIKTGCFRIAKRKGDTIQYTMSNWVSYEHNWSIFKRKNKFNYKFIIIKLNLYLPIIFIYSIFYIF